MQKTNKKKCFLSCVLLFLFCCSSLYAQQKTITGTITDQNGETLIGVSVVVKGATTGTVSDIDGKFSLSVPTSANTLVASYIGMKTTEVPIAGAVVNIKMQDNLNDLDEVIVIGYGTVRKRDLTGPVSSVSGKALRDIPVATAAEAITGRLAGVQVTTTEGSPDADIKIRVRGGGSITGDNTPLYIVDGFPVTTIADIPPSDIESIDVLKDGSSTAIYGARGANGVILVTTKSAKEGKTSVSYNAFGGVKNIAKTLDVLNVPDYLTWQYEATMLRDGNAAKFENRWGAFQDIDLYGDIAGNNWQDQIYGRTGFVFNHNVSISGGTDKIKYMFSYAHIKDKAIMVGSDFVRDNFSLKLTHKAAKNVSIDYSVRYSNTDINGGGTNEQNEKSSQDSRLRHTVIYMPLPPMNSIDDDSSDEEQNDSNLVNPFTAITDTEREQNRKVLNLSGGVSWEIIDNLKLRTDVGFDYYDRRDNRFFGLTTYYVKNLADGNQNLPALQMMNSRTDIFRNTNTLSYDFKKLITNKSHSVNLLLGHELLDSKVNTLTTMIHGFPSTFLKSDAVNLTTQGKPFSTENYFYPDDKLVSFFTRVNYDYKSKYLLAATFRADGSSKFAEGNRWGYFPSAAFAWRVSSEDFMTGTKSWLDDLKLRLGYGSSGNNNIPTGQLFPTFESKITPWVSDFSAYLAPSKIMANPDLKWETTYTRNLGIDYSLFGTKLSGSVEFYLNNTKDLLMLFPISGVGYDNQYRNMGETENRGVEVQLNYVAVDKKDFGLNFNFNIGFNKNKIKSLGIMNDFGQSSGWASTEIGTDYMVAVGGAVGRMYGYISDGRYEVSDFEGYDGSKWILKSGVADASGIVGDLRPGMMKLKNISGDDDKVTIDDRTIIGDANPVHTGGFIINSRFKNFDLSAAFNWSVGNDVYNANKVEYTSTSKWRDRNMISEMESGQRWTNLTADGQISNDPAVLTELNKNTTMWSPYMRQFVFSDWAVEDGSFLRLNTLTLGYTVPASMVKKFHIQNLRFYSSVFNVFCLTNYSGFDPEVSTRRNTNLTPGVDYSAYPKSRQIMFGLNLNF